MPLMLTVARSRHGPDLSAIESKHLRNDQFVNVRAAHDLSTVMAGLRPMGAKLGVQ